MLPYALIFGLFVSLAIVTSNHDETAWNFSLNANNVDDKDEYEQLRRLRYKSLNISAYAEQEHGPVLLKPKCPCHSSSKHLDDAIDSKRVIPSQNGSSFSKYHHGSIHREGAFTVCFILNPISRAFSLFDSENKVTVRSEYFPYNRIYKLLNGTIDVSKLHKKRSDPSSSCHVLINLVQAQPVSRKTCNHKYICPEMCSPIPDTDVPINWIANISLYHQSSLSIDISSIALTCSLTLGDIQPDVAKAIKLLSSKPRTLKSPAFSHWIDSDNRLIYLLIIDMIALRRIQECYERDKWIRAIVGDMHLLNLSDIAHSTTNTSSKVDDSNQGIMTLGVDVLEIVRQLKRNVYGVVIWIGSINRLDMSLSQISALQSQWNISAEDNYISGWIATDTQYPCRPRSTRCHQTMNKNNFNEFLKDSEINFETSGWACAQRRPLRALAHVLSLYDPMFVYLVDDDTFVNQTLFQLNNVDDTGSLYDYIHVHMATNPVVLGFLETKHRLTGGKITQRGILYGGRGYLMGKEVLNRLRSNVVYGPKIIQDQFRSSSQMKYLSILREAYRSVFDSLTCHENKDCLQILTNNGKWMDYNSIGKLSVSLVELCRNLLSEENTCYHSDHAMTRCLAHGAYVDMIHIGCNGTYINYGRNNEFTIFLRTCGFGSMVRDHLLSCHRYVFDRPDLSNKQRSFVIKRHQESYSKSLWCD